MPPFVRACQFVVTWYEYGHTSHAVMHSVLPAVCQAMLASCCAAHHEQLE